MKKYEKKYKIYLLIFLLFVAVSLASAVTFVKSDYFASKARKYLSADISNLLKKKVAIKKIEFSFFSPQIKLYGLSIENVAKISRINIIFGPFDFFRRKIIIYEVNVINPRLNILIKNNKIDNFKNIGTVIKSFSKKNVFPFISVSVIKVNITEGELKLDESDKNFSFSLKNFDFAAYKKPGPIPFLYNNNGIYFKYRMPHIQLKSDKLKLSGIFNSNASEIHYFSGFIKYRKVSFGNSDFTAVSEGLLELNKKNKISGILQKINDSTSINISNLSYISNNFGILPDFKGKLNAKLNVIGDFSEKINAEALINLKKVIFSGGDIKKGVIQCGGNFGKSGNNILNFKKISLNMFRGNLKSSGSINLKEKEGKFKSVLKNINVGRLIEFYDGEKIPQFKAIASGNVTTFLNLGKNFYVENIEKLKASNPVQTLKFKTMTGAEKTYYINYRNRILINGETLVTDKFVLLKNTKVSSRILKGSLEGKINYDVKYLNLNFNATYNELPKASLIQEYKSRYFDPSGSGVIDGNIKGGFQNIYFSFRNRFKTLYINRYLNPYKGNFDFDITGAGDVLFKKVLLEEENPNSTKKGSLDFNGVIFENKTLKKEYIRGSFNAKNIHVISKKPDMPLSLSFDSRGTISGELSNPVLAAAAGSKNAEVYGQYFSNVNFAFLLNKDELRIRKLEGFYKSANFNVYGALMFGGSVAGNHSNNYDLRLISNGVNLENLNLKYIKKYRMKGLVNVNLHIGGRFNLPVVSGNASVNNLSVEDYMIGNINAGINSSGKNMALNLSALNNSIKTKATVLLKKGYPYNFIANINSLNINYRKTLFRLSGGIFGNGKLSDIKKSYVFSKLSYLYLKHGPFFLKNSKDIDISYIDRTLRFAGFELAGGNNFVRLSGKITPKNYDIKINDRTNLWILGIFSDKIKNSSGFITASAVIFGPAASPRIYGYADINRGLIDISGYSSFAASRIHGRFLFNNNLIVLKKIDFRLLNGIFSANGIIRLNNFIPSYYNIIANFNSAVYRESNYFFAKMNGRLGYSGNAGNSVLYGNIDIKKALYDKKINISSFILSYKKYNYNIIKPMVNNKETFNPKLNIRIKSDKGITIKNDIINAKFSADLQLIGTVSDPILLGTAYADSGKIYLRGTMFKLSHANLDFNNKYIINPYFDIAATNRTDQYLIRMNVSGNLSNFNVNFSSTPPLSEMDIISTLALGGPTTSVYASSAGGIAASQAASIIGGGVEQSITGTISSYFGFKNLSVAPSYSMITHSAAPQVSVTKAITKNLSVSYSDLISSQSSQSVTLTYKLSRHISLIGAWENNELAPNNSNVYSEIGGDIVFHFRFY